MTIIPWLGDVRYPVAAAKNAFDITLGKMFQAAPSSETDTEVPYFKSMSIQWGGIQTNPNIRMWATLENCRELAVRSGDLLICEGGDVGRAAIYDGPEGFIFEKSVHRARSTEGSDTRYLGYVLRALHGSEWLDVLCNKATIRHLTGEKLGALEIPVPPVDDQRRIADFLDAETARIDQLALKRRQMRSLLTLKRERVIESTLGLERAQTTDGLVPLKHLVADVTVGIVITPAKWYVEVGGTPALRGLNVKPDFINTGDLVQISAEGDAVNRKSRLNSGDVVVVRTGQAGAAAVVPAELDGANCIDLIVVRPGRKISPRYLQYVLNSGYASARVTEHSVGSIQAHFNVGAMKQIPIPSIPRSEQDEIVRLLDTRVGALDLLHRKLDSQEQLLTERRQALITAAVTGQFDVSTASGRNVTDGVPT
ncbi:restriction endonuclease subunit S [[Kitasatospora] papulosa]|uniref:restriction endonuclease subunit S n=1 Tax=[Kitasatospora] papulosa TaxID=1464011 RepID=UPI002E160693|nr:restriction endonuclease subunit S [[Kitasatospora] papulosa]WSI16325.1 restriction endonuclease subunit S [[Kitasatospora] papulosa]